MAYESLYPTEASMARAISAPTNYNTFSEIMSGRADLETPGRVTNPTDRQNLATYLAGLAGSGVLANSQPGAAAVNGSPTANAVGGDAPKLGPGEGLLDFLPGGTKRTESVLDTVNPVKSDTLEWVKSKMGDIGLVVMGVVVIAVALVAASKSNQQMVIQAVKSAAG